jgi:glycosyltransferase involved in cell wall biosynthesis
MSNNFNPKVSIVIPVYNGSNYVKEAIDSALSQTYDNVEVIVVNDGSTDGGKTDEICESYGDRIRYFLKENGGVASALNMGIEKMEGEYFSWLSHDDVYYPEKVEKQVEALSKLKNKRAIIYSKYEIIDVLGEKIEDVNFEEEYDLESLNKPLFPFFHLLLNGCTMLVHQTHFERVGTFNKDLSTTQDYDLWFRILKNAEIHYVGSTILKSRAHPNQESRANIDKHIQECDLFWKKSIETTSDQMRISLSGKVVEFYEDLYKSFKSKTLYHGFILYLKSRILDEYRNLYRINRSKDILEKVSDDIYEENPSIQLLENILKLDLKKKPRLVFFTGNWYDRGGMNRVISIVSSLLSEKYDVVLCTIKEMGNENGYELAKGVKYIEISEYDFSRIPELLRLLDADIFVGSNNCFVPLLNLYEKIEKLGTKVIMWNHENYFLPLYDLELREVSRIRKEIYEKVSAVVWLSPISAMVCTTFSDNVFQIPNPITITSPQNLKKKEKIGNFISVGRFNSKQKRIDRLLEVFAKIHKKTPNTKLYIVGPYDLNMKAPTGEIISHLISRLDLQVESVVFVGEVGDIERYYEKSSLNIVTSEREGFGLTVIEAASFGIPSVVFDDGGPGEIVEDGVNGYVVKTGDISFMAERILGLIKDEEKYRFLSKESLKMTENYSSEKILAKWQSLIEKVLKSEKVEGETVEFNEETKKIVIMYEYAIEKQMEDTQTGIQRSLLWRITNPMRIIKSKLMVVRRQGAILTIRNLITKLSEKL